MDEAIANRPDYADAFREDVAELSYADVKATDPATAESDVDREMQIVQRSLQLIEEQNAKPASPLINGGDVMRLFSDVDRKKLKQMTQMGFIEEVKEMVRKDLDKNPDLTKEQLEEMILAQRDKIINKYTPVLPYNEVQQMFKDPSTGQLPKDYRFRMNDYTRVHHLMRDQADQPGFNEDMARQIALQEKQRLIDEQLARIDPTQERTGSIRPEIMERYGMNKPSYNLSKVRKIAQNPLGQDNAGYEGFHAQEGGEQRAPDTLIHSTNAHFPYYAGQTVLQRGSGFGFGQGPQGKVEDITPEAVHVKWDNNEKVEKIPNDTITLAGRLQRVN